MRVGLFTDTYTPDINGVVTSIVTLKNALEAQGHTVFVVTNQPSILNTSYEDGILRLPGLEIKFLYGYVVSSPIHIQAMSIIEEMELDIVHAHSEFGIGIFARSVTKKLHLPLVTTYHTTYEDYTHYVNLLGLKSIDELSRKAVAKISRMYSKSSQIIIAPSEKTKKMLLGYKIRKEIAVIPTGLDLDRFDHRNEERLNEIRAQFGVGDLPLFVYIGRLAKEKSIDVVIESFAALVNDGVDAQLLIVGGGPSDKELAELASDLGVGSKVIFVGPVDSSEVINYYHIADAFVSASLTETQGLTYIESLACGLCVFARPDKPLEGIIIDDETGYLFESTQEFVDKAKAFILSDESKKALVKEAALKKASSFDSVSYAHAIETVYQSAIDGYFGRYTIVSLEDEDDDDIFCVIIESKDGHQETITVDEYLIEKKDLKEGAVLSRNNINDLEDEQQIHNAYQKCLSRIGVRDYTSFEMAEYLRTKSDLSQENIDLVIERLVKRHFIDDERYFRDKIDYHRDQKRGNAKILEDLRKRGFETDKILDYLESEDHDDYLERAKDRADKFLTTLRDGSARQRELKLKQHLMRQGFDTETINELVRDHNDAYNEDDELNSLREIMKKSRLRYEKRYDEREVKNRVVKHALSRGYNYDMIVEVLEEYENEN